MSIETRKALKVCGFFLFLFLTVRFLLPLLLPFLLGGLVALAAEPMVSFLCRRARLPRPAAAGVGVGLTLALLSTLLGALFGIALRQLHALAGILPDLESRILGGLQTAWDFLLGLCGRAPEGLRGALESGINRMFSDSSNLVDQGAGFLLRLASTVLSRIPGGMVALGTGILSGFMISAKLPKIRDFLRQWVQRKPFLPFMGGMARMKRSLLGWLTAQCKLSGITFLLSCAGLLLLQVPYAPVWAAGIAVVDAFPVLGTGTLLIPWSFISFLQADRLRAFGLLGLYALCALSRYILEPRLVGKMLGMDPLLTLLSLYLGFRLWGLPGMLLAPILAVTALQVLREGFSPDSAG